MKFFLLTVKNIRRNLLRTTLTVLGTMMLVLVVTLVWSVLDFLDQATAEKSKNLKLIVTERWQIPSRMPFAYANSLATGAYDPAKGGYKVEEADSMTWQFYGGTLDPQNRTIENNLFAIGMDPAKLTTMMDDLDSLPPGPKQEFQKVVDKMVDKKQGIVLGRKRLETINKRVGDRITITSINFRGIDLEFEIIGLFPPGRYDLSAAFNRQYLNDAIDQYPLKHNNQTHPMANGSMNLVWLRVPDSETAAQVAEQIEASSSFKTPAVKCETASSGVSTFIEPYRDIIWGLRWFLAPASAIVLALVISNAISISVRERRLELAVLKVLGFRPNQILVLVLGEALLIGGGAGLLSSTLTWGIINYGYGGLTFPIAFFSSFMIPTRAILWGFLTGSVASLAGSIVPAWSARTVRVSEVFAKVA